MNEKAEPAQPELRPFESPARDCLPCTACCDGWLAADINGHKVAPGHPCPHSSSAGCQIYPDRPHDPCHVFICSWRVKNSRMPDWMRPDVSGAIVLLSMPWEGELVISAVPVGDEIPARTLEWLQAYARRFNRPLIFYQRLVDKGAYTGLKEIGYGPASFRAKVAELSQKTGSEEALMSVTNTEETAP